MRVSYLWGCVAMSHCVAGHVAWIWDFTRRWRSTGSLAAYHLRIVAAHLVPLCALGTTKGAWASEVPIRMWALRGLCAGLPMYTLSIPFRRRGCPVADAAVHPTGPLRPEAVIVIRQRSVRRSRVFGAHHRRKGRRREARSYTRKRTDIQMHGCTATNTLTRPH